MQFILRVQDKIFGMVSHLCDYSENSKIVCGSGKKNVIKMQRNFREEGVNSITMEGIRTELKL